MKKVKKDKMANEPIINQELLEHIISFGKEGDKYVVRGFNKTRKYEIFHNNKRKKMLYETSCGISEPEYEALKRIVKEREDEYKRNKEDMRMFTALITDKGHKIKGQYDFDIL
jgi:hypothetical protein